MSLEQSLALEAAPSNAVSSTSQSSSPSDSQRDEQRNSNATLPPIKRPARIYGKRHEPTTVSENTEPMDLPLYNSTSLRNTHNPARSNRDGHPYASPVSGELSPNEDIAVDAYCSTAPKKFEFAWKKQLREMEEDDYDGATDALAPVSTDTYQISLGKPFLLEEKVKDFAASANSETTSPLSADSYDIFDGASATQREQMASHGQSFHDSFVLSSPKLAPPTRKRLGKVVHDSDSEVEPSKASSSTTPSSQPLHNINTPKSTSLTNTPPTSDDEMATKKSSKGKRKAGSTRDSVPPINLIELPVGEAKAFSSNISGRTKVKPLTKKDEAEMMKERVRMAAGSNASSVIRRGTSSKYTTKSLFETIGGNMLPSDPIESYSSPPGRTRTTSNATTSAAGRASNSSPRMRPLVPVDHSDSDELPEVSEVIKQAEANSKKEELKKTKKRLLEQQKFNLNSQDTDDEDLEIVSPNPRTCVKEEGNRRSAQKPRMSRTRQQQFRLAHVNPSKHKGSNPTMNAATGSPRALRTSDRLDQASLNRLLTTEARKQAQDLAKKKADYWGKHGGRVVVVPEAPALGLNATLQIFADKGLKVAGISTALDMDVDERDEDDDDAEDGDWDPTMRGSASPEPMQEDQGSESENDENMVVEHDNEISNEEVDVDGAGKSKIRPARRLVVASDSESEHDENKPMMPSSNKYRRATPSVDSNTEDDHDKENNNDLVYDRSDDKENTATVRHTSFGRSRSIFDIGLPLSPSTEWPSRSQTDNEGESNGRRPFQELLSDKSPTAGGQSSRLTQSFASKLQQASPLPSTMAPAPTLKPFLESQSASSKGFDGFSQFFEDGNVGDIGQASVLEPGFSDLFESGTERPSPPKLDKGKANLMDDDLFFEPDSARKPTRAGLDLTQDVSAALNLQPAFQVKENLLRKADAIFEKEQAYVVEAALSKPSKKPELYVNDHGFLTQTKPTDRSPEIYRLLPTQQIYGTDQIGGSMLSLDFRPRAPLRTLSVSSTTQPDSPTQQPLRRLKKAASPTPGLDNVLSSPSTTPPLRQNAFQALARGAAKAHRHATVEDAFPGINLSEYLEAEAAESDDEDNTFGFVKKKTADDEEGEDLDQTLTELMDDKEMDDSEVAADLVLEKFQEQEQEQDKKDQELHEAAISGLLRKKRTRGVGVDDSDDESDDEGNERARRAMKKLRTSERGDIQALAANEATEAFAAVYNQSLKDDDDFAYLAAESNLDDLLPANQTADGTDSNGDEEEEAQQETISAQEVMLIARQMKEDGVEGIGIDPEDVSWVDKDADDDAPSIRTVQARKPQRVLHRDVDPLDMDVTMGGPFGKVDPLNIASKQWYAQENKSRNAGTSRSVGGSAITGHAKVKPKAGSSSRQPHRSKAGTTSVSAGSNRSLKSERSMLSAITDKSRHFA